ncbi:MAG: preprotein translocase subunit SecE [Verrucomicrobiales bacterium]|nr:preprotein translocase subunit SecE [Verrucomicrobiales bacterium]
MFGKVGKFFGEVRSELHKATWPWDPKEKGVKRYKQLIDSTVVVLIATLLLGAFVAFFDFLMVNVMKAITVGFGA